MASFLSTLRAGPPPPKVALLPDGLFFTRPVAVTAGATPAEAVSQIELALEAVSPFPLTQLYYGYHWQPGSAHALVYAAYRRRFTTDQTASWADTDLVLPAFATLLGARIEPATTVVLASAEGLTAVHWGPDEVPGGVLFRPFPSSAAEESEASMAQSSADRERLRDELVRSFEGSRRVIELDAPPAAQPTHRDRDYTFRSGELTSRLPATVTTALDVRDKGDLAALRGARQRDVVLWRITLGCAAAFLLLAVGELALQGGRQWQKVRGLKQRSQQPTVEKIMASQSLAYRIDELATKRLLPFEMIVIISGKKGDIQLTRAYTKKEKGLYTIFVDAKTNNAAQIPVFKTALKQLPECDNVESIDERIRNETATFTLIVTFKPDAVKPSSPI
ncbi:MAG: hypothetical protein HZA93_18990 [Verrucomicrobia bacterium]|nr:hypothetical protein [Verrucomicrobiota bacterium]